MKDYLLSPIRLNEFEVLIENSVQRAIKHHSYKSNDLEQIETPLNIDDAVHLTGFKKPTIYAHCQNNTLNPKVLIA